MTYEITMDNKNPESVIPIIRVTIRDMTQALARAYAEENFPDFKIRYVMGAVNQTYRSDS